MSVFAMPGISVAGLTVKVDERIRVVELNAQGYGLQLIFSDGHERGIYPWPYLAQLGLETTTV